ncbi:MAG: 50S ribosomal protein L1 [Patescibacteria group bacterium]
MNTKIKKLYSSLDREKNYPIAEALDLVKKSAKAKFDETVELHIKLGIDPKKGEQQVRGNVVLAHNFGASKKVAAFVSADKAKEAKEAGADLIITEAELEDFKKAGKTDFDVAIATPEMMKAMAPLARILGPKGLMPSPKNETITMNIKKTIDELKKGKISFKNDDTANIHLAFGKASMKPEELLANYQAFIDAITKSKPETSKGTYLKNITICSTMGPAIKVQA